MQPLVVPSSLRILEPAESLCSAAQQLVTMMLGRPDGLGDDASSRDVVRVTPVPPEGRTSSATMLRRERRSEELGLTSRDRDAGPLGVLVATSMDVTQLPRLTT